MHKNSENVTFSAYNPQMLRIIKRTIFRDELNNRFLQIYFSMLIVVSEDDALLQKKIVDKQFAAFFV